MAIHRIREFLSPVPQWLRLIFFLVGYFMLNYIYFLFPNEVLIDVVYFQGMAIICADLINFVAPLEAVAALKNHLASSHANLEIIRGCDGAGALFLIIAAILVSPSTFCRKLFGLILGMALIYVLNLIRISGLYFVIAYQPDWFLLVHTYLAPTLIIAVGCLYFAWWVFGSTHKAHEPS
ncbi:MAG: exosortase family protein XrtM [Methylococcaceae bacterium]|nr:exosortase family protein XrtM [Methylococcaceae bacterium]